SFSPCRPRGFATSPHASASERTAIVRRLSRTRCSLMPILPLISRGRRPDAVLPRAGSGCLLLLQLLRVEHRPEALICPAVDRDFGVDPIGGRRRQIGPALQLDGRAVLLKGRRLPEMAVIAA